MNAVHSSVPPLVEKSHTSRHRANNLGSLPVCRPWFPTALTDPPGFSSFLEFGQHGPAGDAGALGVG